MNHNRFSRLNIFVDRLLHLVPAPDGGDDFVRISGPSEGLWIVACLREEAVDAGLEVDDRAEDAAFEAAFGQLGEEALDGIQPRARCRHEVEREALVPVEPCAHLGVLVNGVVVEDDMDEFAGRDVGLDGIEEADELFEPCHRQGRELRLLATK
jgi:hypothetical protein